MSQDATALLSVVQDYLDAIYWGDPDALRRSMHPRARLWSATDGELVELDVDAYVERLEGRVPPARRGDARQDRVLSLEFASATTAHVRVQNAYLPKKFTDDLTFIRLDDTWQIIAKVWHFDL